MEKAPDIAPILRSPPRLYMPPINFQASGTVVVQAVTMTTGIVAPTSPLKAMTWILSWTSSMWINMESGMCLSRFTTFETRNAQRKDSTRGDWSASEVLEVRGARVSGFLASTSRLRAFAW
jgi:hypothetical protein